MKTNLTQRRKECKEELWSKAKEKTPLTLGTLNFSSL
jgi:hypothetical protein